MDYQGPSLFRGLAEKYNVTTFDRVTKIVVHRYGSLSHVDLGAFTQLRQITKSIGPKSVSLDQNLPKKEALVKFDADITKSVQVLAKEELKGSLSPCQIKNVEHDRTNWTADINPNPLACSCSNTAQ